MRRTVGLVVGGLVVAFATVAGAQATQIKPRVLLMVDTSGSMTESFDGSRSTGGDGSTFYSDAIMTRSLASDRNLGLYVGFETGANAPMCPADATIQYDGFNSRMYAAKQAVSDVVNGSGDVDWGLMRYSGDVCDVVDTFTRTSGNCTSDDACDVGEFCVGGKCGTDDNLCHNYSTNGASYGCTRKSGGTCRNRVGNNGNALTYSGSCGTSLNAGDAGCATPQVCYSDADCRGGAAGSCIAFPNSAAKACRCDGSYTCDGTVYSCGSNNFCEYAEGCRNPGGTVLVDPSTPNGSSQVLPYVDGIEALPNNLAGIPVNPELRAVNSTPLAGAARAATSWYQNVIGSDPKAKCRPYVLVQLTDGEDSCDDDIANGPVAAAGSFVAATVPGAKTLNKVYVVGINVASTRLDNIAHVGGTGKARLANSQQDIEAALADIVSSSVLVEKCNGIDDNCNGQCDENFPGVEVDATAPDGTTCSNAHSAATCDNGYPIGTACYDAGVFVCSADQLGQVCSAQSCSGGNNGTISSPSPGVMRISATGPFNVPASAVGQLLWVANAKNGANNGVFPITAVGASSVDVTNAGVMAPDANTVAYGVPTTQGTAAIAVGGGNETLTVASTAGVKVGDTVYVVGAAQAAYDGVFTVSSVTASTIVVPAKAGAPNGSDSGKWLDPRVCPGFEVCNGRDDDCDGIVDNCGDSVAGSCCASACNNGCAKPPYIETCNNCDDDCDGVVDNHLVDVGLACGNDVGDCAPGTTVCCSNDPNASVPPGTCNLDGVNDKIWCQGGNPGYPKPADLCDGTDDNCNGIANDNPPQECDTDGTNTLPPGSDGKGVCHHGILRCMTTPLPPGDPGCPAGWPAGKPCPSSPPVYGPVCEGLVLPTPEVCNGLDDDCDGVPDNNLGAPFGQPCCDTGNSADCTNTTTNGMTGTRCKMGVWVCTASGQQVCQGAVHKTLEICDMTDNDCDGVVDDVPGVGSACTGNGVETRGSCTGKLACAAGPQPVCVQDVGPTMETCNGLDDNCNGEIDDTDPPLPPAGGNLPGVGVACDIPMPPQDQPPCKPGTTVCIAGNIVCQGAVHPMPNQCNGVSTDCTGQPNTNGNCPTGYQCYQGNCVAPCATGEFPCPGGYACNTGTTACDDPMTGAHPGCCVPDACATANCPPGDICQLDAQGNAQCIDPCSNVNCPTGFICKLGACVDASCRTQGCPPGQLCITDANNMSTCVDDPCKDVTCPDGQFCHDGQCVQACKGPCPPGTYCDQGMCAPDPCAHLPCVEGQACHVENGVGVCVDDLCRFGCNLGLACCGGACISDPCASLHCPEDTHCALTPACDATCETNPPAPKDQIVGAGGGGFGCAMGGGHTPAGGAAWLLLALGVLLGRRRRAAEVRR